MHRALTAVALLGALALSPATAQQALSTSGSAVRSDPKPALTPADYGKWETLGNGVLSPDGKWIAYGIRRVNDTHELRWHAVTTDSGHVVAAGENPAFSRDGRWLVYTVGINERDREKAKPPIRNKVGIVDLRSGTTTVIEQVQSFALSDDGGYLVMRRYAPEGRRTRGADLVVRDLARSSDATFGNVAEYAWREGGTLLAMTIDAEQRTTNGVHLYDPATGVLRVLDSGDAVYSGLGWRRKSDDLVVLRSITDSAWVDTAYSAIAWRGVASAAPRRSAYAADTEDATPMRIAEWRRPQWAEDGSTIFLGLAPRERKPAKPVRDSTKGASDEPEAAAVEIWHARDVRVHPVQKLRATQDRQRTYLTAWDPGANRAVRLADDSLETVRIIEGARVATAAEDGPYEVDGMFGRSWRDLWTIDLATGERKKVATKVPAEGPVSPGGRYLLYAQDEQWWTHDLRTGTRSSISKGIATSVVDREDDHPVAHRSPYGVAGWTKNDASVILYDRYDLWEVRPDGSRPVRLTRGAEDSVRYRYLRLDPEERSIDPAKPMYLSATHDRTKASGIARVTVGKGAERLVWQEKSVGRLVKARDADVFAWVVQAWDDSPDYFVAGPTLQGARQVTRTNPFQKDYAWGKSELVEYTNSRGERLQGILTYPANYEPGRRYPMVVYIYERLTQGLHSYTVPSERSSYSIPAFSQRGYFVLRPDIVFRPRDPGGSIVDCVTSAVQRIAETGMIDPSKVGVMGHSWGGYGSAYLATHTQGVFAAANAGAPLTNLVSFYGYTSGNTGQPETGHFETGQERMEVPLWEDPQAYIRNSPLFGMKQATVPLLVEFGDKDGNVDFGQGIEFYNAARRLGKDRFVMIVYNDENHGLAVRKNQIDYHRRQVEWFDHFLKGAPAGKWITEGLDFLEREREVKAQRPPG